MSKVVEIKVKPSQKDDDNHLVLTCAKQLKIDHSEIKSFKILRRSIDARKKRPFFLLRIEVFFQDEEESSLEEDLVFQKELPKEIIIVGAGPAGYFAALECLTLGIRPIVVDRGKDVQTRRRDLRSIQQEHRVPINSNYCFGEGGAGTYSDGKLYTRSNKRGNIGKVLNILVDHGATSDILIDAHPHIGSNKLPSIVAAIRETIEANGGQVHFDAKVVDFLIQDSKILGVQLEDGKELRAASVILSTGHSARDIYELCGNSNVDMEFKPFAMGVRIEHPQSLIDKIQYGQSKREDGLPAASYRLACQVEKRGVFSFCMCPGGLIVPTATAPNEMVVNGMSLSKRDSPFANSGLVVSIENNPNPESVFGGLEFQKKVEQAFFANGDGSIKAPAQRITDFVNQKESRTVKDSSYIPGLYSARIDKMLPEWIAHSLREALLQFGKKMKGYYTEEAQMIGLESRTSSPVRIMREKESLMSPSLEALFPCGEGAGFAGGILSAALDGQRVAQKVSEYLSKK